MKITKDKNNQFIARDLDVVITLERVERSGCYLKVTLQSKDGLKFDFRNDVVYLQEGNTLTVSGIRAMLDIENNTIECTPSRKK